MTLEVQCVDRLYLNGYVPRLQSSGGVVTFLTRARGHAIPSPAVFGEITGAFKTRLRAWCQARAIPWIEFKKGERKDDIVQPYRERFSGRTGVVLVGVAQERASGWTASKTQQGRRKDFTYRRKSVCVNHYYFYLIDPEWGPAFLKVCGYAPYAIKLCLNGHEWAKRQLRRRRAGQRIKALCCRSRLGPNPRRRLPSWPSRHPPGLTNMAACYSADEAPVKGNADEGRQPPGRGG